MFGGQFKTFWLLATDNVRLQTIGSDGTLTSTTTYPDNTLYKTTTWDNLDNTTSRTEEFKDKQEKVVNRSYNGTEKLSTYYVYDDFDLLRLVLTPKAMGDMLYLVLNQWTCVTSTGMMNGKG